MEVGWEGLYAEAKVGLGMLKGERQLREDDEDCSMGVVKVSISRMNVVHIVSHV